MDCSLRAATAPQPPVRGQESRAMPTSPESPESPFEKTFRLVCRLDDADIDYVRDTAEWIRRLVARALEVHPGASADELTPLALDMSTRGRWRLMRPEIVAEQLAPAEPRGPR